MVYYDAVFGTARFGESHFATVYCYESTVTISDAINKAQSLYKILSESITISDGLIKLIHKHIEEQITVSDSIARLQMLVKGLSETITLSESIMRRFFFSRNIIENITISDLLEGIKLEEIRHHIRVFNDNPIFRVLPFPEEN